MWIFTTDGHFSAAFNEYCKPDEIVIRARTEFEIENLRTRLSLPPIVETPNNPYPYQIILKRSVWAGYVAECVNEINYRELRKAKLYDILLISIYNAVWIATLNSYNLIELKIKHGGKKNDTSTKRRGAKKRNKK